MKVYHATEVITEYTSKTINRNYFSNTNGSCSNEIFSIVSHSMSKQGEINNKIIK